MQRTRTQRHVPAYQLAAAALYSIARRGTISARWHKRRRALDGAAAAPFPGLRCRSTRTGNPVRGSTHRDSLRQCCYLLRSITSAQRRMILVTRHLGALTQMLLQVAFTLPQKCSASLAMQEFTRSCVVITLSAQDSHMEFCCPLRTLQCPTRHYSHCGGQSNLTAGIRTQNLTHTQTACLMSSQQHPPSLHWCCSKHKWTRQRDHVIRNPARRCS